MHQFKRQVSNSKERKVETEAGGEISCWENILQRLHLKNSPVKTVSLIGSIWSNLSPTAMPMTTEKLETTGPDDQV